MPAGQTIALVGAMGSGKSALVQLLPRLYDVTTGSVSIDGADVRSVQLDSLRRELAVVTDDPFLFSATVHDNIAYARADASRDEVERAAAAAQADGFIERLPKGYDTMIGERGLTLSGGQRQRIAIARAILAEPRILVLDDATSSVDASTESEIKEALQEVMADRTTFVIAHRLSTIALADRIVVLDHGRVIADGSHDELLEQLGAVPRDRRAGHARPGLPHPQDPGGGGTMSVMSRTELRRRLQETGGRGRKLRGLAEILSPYRWRVAAMFVSLLLATAASLAPAPLAKIAIDKGIDRHDVGALDVVVVVFLISAVVYGVCTYAQTYLVGWVGQRALRDLRLKLFVHLQSLSIAFYSRNRAGVVISRMTNDVEALDQLVEDGLATLIQSSLTLIGVVVILLVLDFHLALLTFLALPVLFVGALAFRIASADAYRLTRERIASITGYLAESLSGIRVVRSFGQERRHIDEFHKLNRSNLDANMTTVKLNAAYFPAVELLSALVTVEILAVGGLEAINGHTSTGVVFAFVAALNNFFDPIQQLSQLYTTYQSGMAALDKIFGLLDEEPELVDAPDAQPLPPIRGQLEFRDVSFRYGSDDDGAWALRDIDLDVAPGADRRAGRRDRRRQVDVRQARGALL